MTTTLLKKLAHLCPKKRKISSPAHVDNDFEISSPAFLSKFWEKFLVLRIFTWKSVLGTEAKQFFLEIRNKKVKQIFEFFLTTRKSQFREHQSRLSCPKMEFLDFEIFKFSNSNCSNCSSRLSDVNWRTDTSKTFQQTSWIQSHKIWKVTLSSQGSSETSLFRTFLWTPKHKNLEDFVKFSAQNF